MAGTFRPARYSGARFWGKPLDEKGERICPTQNLGLQIRATYLVRGPRGSLTVPRTPLVTEKLWQHRGTLCAHRLEQEGDGQVGSERGRAGHRKGGRGRARRAWGKEVVTVRILTIKKKKIMCPYRPSQRGAYVYRPPGGVTAAPTLDGTAPLARTMTRQTRPRRAKDSRHMGQLKKGSGDQWASAASAGAAPTRVKRRPRTPRVRSCASNASPFETTHSPSNIHNETIANCYCRCVAVPGCCKVGGARGRCVTVVMRRRQKWPNQSLLAKKQHGFPCNASKDSTKSPHMGQRRMGAAGKRAAMRSATKVGCG